MSVCRWLQARARGLRGGRAAAWLAACAALGALLALRAPQHATLEADFPQHSPAYLAHFLADFTNHPKLYTHLSGSWRVEEESSNGTWWSYAVSYECGPRCAGRVLVQHAAPPAAAPAAPHRLRVRDERCAPAAPALLPWPLLCESTETETEISPRGGGGARLREEARVRCGARRLTGACDARAARRRHLRALRDALAHTGH